MSAAVAFLGVTTDRRAYLGFLYAMLRLPLALAYFMFLAIAIPTAGSLLVVGIGFAIFVLILLAAWGCAIFERELARWWFGFELRPMAIPGRAARTWWQHMRDFLTSPVAWKSLLYMVIQIPLGAVCFAIVLALTTIALALVAAPVIDLIDIGTAGAADSGSNVWGLTDPANTLAATLLLGSLGIVLAVATLHVARALALGQGSLIRALLGMSKAQVELSAARSEAATQSARAERSDQSRRELVVNVSHELRTPIASIRGHVESLLDPRGGQPSAEETKRYLEIVAREAERLGSLVDDLTAVARADAGELRLDILPTDLAPIVQHAAEALGPIARRDRKVTLTTSVAEGVPAAYADAGRLSQVLINLVRNAINYTPEGGIVSIELADGGAGHVMLAVADTGVGIPPEDLDRIFDRLYRVDPSRTRATGGFGLGLAIAKDLVQAMGGSIAVASEPGNGSRFTVQLRRV